MLAVGLLMWETIGLTDIGFLCSFLRKYINGVLGDSGGKRKWYVSLSINPRSCALFRNFSLSKR